MTRTIAVITTEANAVARQVHTRMPVVLVAAPVLAALVVPLPDCRLTRKACRSAGSAEAAVPRLLVVEVDEALAQDGGTNPA